MQWVAYGVWCEWGSTEKWLCCFDKIWFGCLTWYSKTLFILSTINWANKTINKEEIIKTKRDSVNHTRLPTEDHLPDWALRDNKVTKGDRLEYKYITKHMTANLIYVTWNTRDVTGEWIKFADRLLVNQRTSNTRKWSAASSELLHGDRWSWEWNCIGILIYRPKSRHYFLTEVRMSKTPTVEKNYFFSVAKFS